MPKANFQLGQLVVCFRTNDPRYGYLVGATGEIKEMLPGFVAMVMESDCVVEFPGMRDALCPACNKSHQGKFAMAFNELKPLDDPDKGQQQEEDKDLNIEVEEVSFGFITAD
jgi:hypothetical protein